MRMAYEYLGPLLKSNSSTASEIEMMSSKIPAVDRSSIYGPWTLVEFANFSSTGSKVVWTGTQSGMKLRSRFVSKASRPEIEIFVNSFISFDMSFFDLGVGSRSGISKEIPSLASFRLFSD